MRGGKVYGNAIETADGAVLRYDALFRVEGELLSKSKMRRIAKLLGMGDSRFEKGYFTTTLDDMAKFFKMLMDGGIYGGQVHLAEQVRDRLILVVYSIMYDEDGMKMSDDGLRVWADADKTDIVFRYVNNK